MLKRVISIAIVVVVAIIVSICILIATNQIPLSGELLLEKQLTYSLDGDTSEMPETSTVFYESKLGFTKSKQQYVFNVSFDPNSDLMVGIYRSFVDSQQQIAYLKMDEKKDLQIEKIVYTNLSQSIISSTKAVPDSNKISFMKDGRYFILDPDTQQVTGLDVENAHKLVWLDNQTFFYTHVVLPDLYYVQIRKYNINTQEDTLFIDYGYGSSLSANRRFLAYGKSDTPDRLYIQNLDTGAVETVSYPPYTYSDKTKFECMENDFKNNRVKIGDIVEKDPFYIAAKEDEYDGCVFKPSSDGKQLLYQAKNEEHVKLIDIKTAKVQIIYKDFPAANIDWKDT